MVVARMLRRPTMSWRCLGGGPLGVCPFNGGSLAIASFDILTVGPHEGDPGFAPDSPTGRA
jgi:hypothetical protein